jgi:flagellum-specific ATP synthase
MRNVVSPEHFHQAMHIRNLMATYREAEDLINIGAYKSGSSPRIDAAIHAATPIEALLKQEVTESSPFEETEQMMMSLE